MTRPQLETAPLTWRLRDTLAALALFVATCAVVLWQNAHVAVLWDMSYVLDTAVRLAQGQMPYRDFPLVHPPLCFMVQAAILRLTGGVYFYHALYCAVAGGLGSLIAWRMILRAFCGRLAQAWTLSVALALPLTVLGLYCVFPFPSYDCDTLLTVLFALWLFQRLSPDAGLPLTLATGAAQAVPLFVKQNIGLPMLAAWLPLLLALAIYAHFRPSASPLRPRQLLALAGGALLTAAIGFGLIEATAGLGNYLHWTITFAGQRRLPGLSVMAGIYASPSLVWMLPAALIGLLFVHTPLARKHLWLRLTALSLLAAPFLSAVIALFFNEDADTRGDALLDLWPLVLLLAALLVLIRAVAILRGQRPVELRLLVLITALGAIHGTLMSQQIWGSTYALWPLFGYLLAEIFSEAFSSEATPEMPRWLPAAAITTTAAALLVAGAFYTASEERLSYANLEGAPALGSNQPALAGVSTPGRYLADFDELVAFANAAIPPKDGVLLLPGEDPFSFATGRPVPFPVLLFDPSTDPFTPAQTLEAVHQHAIHWLVVKRALQIREDPTPNRDETLKLLTREFFPVAELHGYTVYHFAGAHPHNASSPVEHP